MRIAFVSGENGAVDRPWKDDDQSIGDPSASPAPLGLLPGPDVIVGVGGAYDGLWLLEIAAAKAGAGGRTLDVAVGMRAASAGSTSSTVVAGRTAGWGSGTASARGRVLVPVLLVCGVVLLLLMVVGFRGTKPGLGGVGVVA